MDDKLKELVNDIYAKVKAAEDYANQTGQSFDMDLAYGMGGTYYPKRTMTKKEIIERIKQGVTDETERWLLKNLLENAYQEYIPGTLEKFAEGFDADWEDSEDWYDSDSEGWRSSSSMC